MVKSKTEDSESMSKKNNDKILNISETKTTTSKQIKHISKYQLTEFAKDLVKFEWGSDTNNQSSNETESKNLHSITSLFSFKEDVFISLENEAKNHENKKNAEVKNIKEQAPSGTN